MCVRALCVVTNSTLQVPPRGYTRLIVRIIASQITQGSRMSVGCGFNNNNKRKSRGTVVHTIALQQGTGCTSFYHRITYFSSNL